MEAEEGEWRTPHPQRQGGTQHAVLWTHSGKVFDVSICNLQLCPSHGNPTAAGVLLGALISCGTPSFANPGLGVNVAYVSLLEKSFLNFIDWGSLNKSASCRGSGC